MVSFLKTEFYKCTAFDILKYVLTFLVFERVTVDSCEGIPKFSLAHS